MIERCTSGFARFRGVLFPLQMAYMKRIHAGKNPICSSDRASQRRGKAYVVPMRTTREGVIMRRHVKGIGIVLAALAWRLAWADVAIVDDPSSFRAEAKELPTIVEPPVPIFRQGLLIGGANHQLVEFFDAVPNDSGFPSTFVDIIANTFVRATYQTPNGASGAYGTSVLASPSFRDAFGLKLLPTVLRGDILLGGPSRYESTVAAQFGADAKVTSRRRFPDPETGRTVVDLDVAFDATRDIRLASGTPFAGNDRMRLLTISSMFADERQYDANYVRYDDLTGVVRTLTLTGATARDRHLFDSPVEVRSFVEVGKTLGSQWFGDSPTVRVTITDKGGKRLGVQGFLAGTRLPSDDSLSVWLEWLDAPDIIPAGTRLQAGFQMTASPPRIASGWWWNPAESGRGYYLEQQGNSLFMAAFLYEVSGRATWLAAAGPMQSATSLHAPLLEFQGGQTLDGPYIGPNSREVGTVSLTFSDANRAVLQWPGGTVPLQRFDIVQSGATQPHSESVEKGWWWNRQESGRGFAVEIQNEFMFLAGFMYNTASEPTWYLAASPMATPQRYAGTLSEFADGQTLGGSYQPPVVVDADVGQVLIEFHSPTSATMTLPSGRQIALERFRFDD